MLLANEDKPARFGGHYSQFASSGYANPMSYCLLTRENSGNRCPIGEVRLV